MVDCALLVEVSSSTFGLLSDNEAKSPAIWLFPLTFVVELAGDEKSNRSLTTAELEFDDSTAAAETRTAFG